MAVKKAVYFTYGIFGNSSKPSLKDLLIVLPASYFSSPLMAQLIAMGHPIPVICSKTQTIPANGLPMVKNKSQGRQTDKNERPDIKHHLRYVLSMITKYNITVFTNFC